MTWARPWTIKEIEEDILRLRSATSIDPLTMEPVVRAIVERFYAYGASRPEVEVIHSSVRVRTRDSNDQPYGVDVYASGKLRAWVNVEPMYIAERPHTWTYRHKSLSKVMTELARIAGLSLSIRN